MLEIVAIAECDSTQDWARRWLAQQTHREQILAGEGLLVHTSRQTHGRGQHGRSWLAAGESLALSMVMAEPTPAPSPGAWPLLAMASTLRALQSWLPAERAAALQLKWPNDLLLGAAKAGGVLVERLPVALGQGAPAVLIVGIGLNGRQAPALVHPAADAPIGLPVGLLLEGLPSGWRLSDLMPLLASSLARLQSPASAELWQLAQQHLAFQGQPMVWLAPSGPPVEVIPRSLDPLTGGLWVQPVVDSAQTPRPLQLLRQGSLRPLMVEAGA